MPESLYTTHKPRWSSLIPVWSCHLHGNLSYQCFLKWLRFTDVTFHFSKFLRLLSANFLWTKVEPTHTLSSSLNWDEGGSCFIVVWPLWVDNTTDLIMWSPSFEQLRNAVHKTKQSRTKNNLCNIHCYLCNVILHPSLVQAIQSPKTAVVS